MDAQEVLLSRRTIHMYEPGPIPSGCLENALRAAHHAPNHRHTFPWRFTCVGPETRAALTDVYVEMKSRSGPIADERVLALRNKFLNPSELVIVSQVRSEDSFRAREDYAACACAIQNLMVSLWSAGVASKWSTGSVTRSPQTYDLLQIDPAYQEIVGFIWVGYGTPPPPVKRPPLRDVLRHLP